MNGIRRHHLAAVLVFASAAAVASPGGGGHGGGGRGGGGVHAAFGGHAGGWNGGAHGGWSGGGRGGWRGGYGGWRDGGHGWGGWGRGWYSGAYIGVYDPYVPWFDDPYVYGEGVAVLPLSTPSQVVPPSQVFYRYYCPSVSAYYPDVPTCPVPWLRVLPGN